MIRLLAAAFSVILLAGCSSGSDSVSSDSAGSDSPDGGPPQAIEGPAYELEVTSLGDSQRSSLTAAAPVGAEQIVDVEIEGADGMVAARLTMTVDRSEADGSSQSAIFTVAETAASDEILAQQMKAFIGSTLTVERDQAWMVVDREQNLLGVGAGVGEGEGESVSAAFWIEQLLAAPTLYAGPMPTVAVGEGATWQVVLRGPAGESENGESENGESENGESENTGNRTLTGLDSDRFIVSGTSGSYDITIEGRIGQPIPDRQEWSDENWSFTVRVRES